MVEALYFGMLASFLAHEMDAAYRGEWRVLPLLSRLSDEAGRHVFVLGHVPLIFMIFWFNGLKADGPMALGLSAFAVIHFGLRALYRNHAKYDLHNALSRTLIWGTGVLGAGHLVLIALG